MLWLQIGAERFPVRQGETTLGRSVYCSVIINSNAASREHAVIVAEGDCATLTDVGSRNGTILNGHRLGGPEQLHGGDVIIIGSAEIAVVDGPVADSRMTTTDERRVPTEPPPPARATIPEAIAVTTAPPPGKASPKKP